MDCFAAALLAMTLRDSRHDQHRSRHQQPRRRPRQETRRPAHHRRRLAAGARRRDAVRGRRKRLGQVGDVADRDGPAAKGRAGADRRQHQAGRRGTAHRHRPAPAPAARHQDGDDLSGADDRAQPGGPGRPPDRRGLARPYRSRRARPSPEDPGDDGACPAARRGAHLRLLSAPAVGRPAPAHHDRDGAGARTQAADRGRADHRARRHHAEADPDPDPRPAARSRHRRAVHHP